MSNKRQKSKKRRGRVSSAPPVGRRGSLPPGPRPIAAVTPTEPGALATRPGAVAAEPAARGAEPGAVAAEPVRELPGGQGTSLGDPSPIDAAFFGSAPGGVHWPVQESHDSHESVEWGVETTAPSVAILAQASERRTRLTKYVRAAVTFSVAVCVAALVKAVALRDPDSSPPAHPHGVTASPPVEHAGGDPLPAGASQHSAAPQGAQGRETTGRAAGSVGDPPNKHRR